MPLIGSCLLATERQGLSKDHCTRVTTFAEGLSAPALPHLHHTLPHPPEQYNKLSKYEIFLSVRIFSLPGPALEGALPGSWGRETVQGMCPKPRGGGVWWPWAKGDLSIVTPYSTAALVSKSQCQCSEPCCSAVCQGSCAGDQSFQLPHCRTSTPGDSAHKIPVSLERGVAIPGQLGGNGAAS